jgi:hypothetical protein
MSSSFAERNCLTHRFKSEKIFWNLACHCLKIAKIKIEEKSPLAMAGFRVFRSVGYPAFAVFFAQREKAQSFPGRHPERIRAESGVEGTCGLFPLARKRGLPTTCPEPVEGLAEMWSPGDRARNHMYLE